jgi:hypothetical protein
MAREKVSSRLRLKVLSLFFRLSSSPVGLNSKERRVHFVLEPRPSPLSTLVIGSFSLFNYARLYLERAECEQTTRRTVAVSGLCALTTGITSEMATLATYPLVAEMRKGGNNFPVA